MPKIDCFLLVDSAQVSNGKLFILGGGWARLTSTQIPVTRTFETAIRVVVPWTETNRPHPMELQIENEDGQALLETPVKAEIRVGRPAQLKDGTDQVVPLALRVGPVTLIVRGAMRSSSASMAKKPPAPLSTSSSAARLDRARLQAIAMRQAHTRRRAQSTSRFSK